MTTSTTGVHDLGLQPSPLPLLRRSDGGARFDHAVRTGVLVRVRSGVYVDAAAWEALPPWDRYLVRVHALAHKSPTTVFTHESAAALWGLPVLGRPHDLHVRVHKPGAARRTGDVQGHHFVDDRRIVEMSGVFVTDPIDTVVDLARTRHPIVARVAADAVLRAGAATPSTLADANDDRSSPRGRSNARWPLEGATAQAETVLESVSLAEIDWLGFEIPEMQVECAAPDGSLDRVDFWWPLPRIVGEADGRAKYALTDDALWHEKRREDRLRLRVAGVARWAWEDLRTPPRLRSILEAAGVPQARPPRWEPLRTVGRLL